MNRQQKIKFLKDLKAGKTSITELIKPQHATEFWKHNNGFYINSSTGGRYTEAEFETRPKPKVKILRTVIFKDYSK